MRTVVALGFVALIAVMGLCLLDGDHVSKDLCVSFLAVTSGLLLAALLLLLARFVPAVSPAYHPTPPDLPAPPEPAKALADRITNELGWAVTVPGYRDRFALD